MINHLHNKKNTTTQVPTESATKCTYKNNLCNFKQFNCNKFVINSQIKKGEK